VSEVTETVADVLTRYGAGIAEADLAETLDVLLREHWEPLRGGAQLAASDRRLLEASGGLRFDDEAALEAAVTTTTGMAARLVATSVSVAELAAALGVDASRVRHRLAAGELYAMPSGRGRARLIPRFQLDDMGRPLPGLGAVLAALPGDLHPLEVEGFFSTAQPELEVDDEPVSPRTWLAAGGNPEPVVELAGGLFTLAQ
jgi:hypothetical protein